MSDFVEDEDGEDREGEEEEGEEDGEEDGEEGDKDREEEREEEEGDETGGGEKDDEEAEDKDTVEYEWKRIVSEKKSFSTSSSSYFPTASSFCDTPSVARPKRKRKIVQTSNKKKKEGAVYVPTKKPVLLAWREQSAQFDVNAVSKTASPNQAKTSEQLGFGVVAKRALSSGAIVCSYGGRVLSEREYSSVVAYHDPRCARVAYLIEIVPKTWFLDGFPEQSETLPHIGQFVNDSRGIDGCATNCMLEVDATRERRGLYAVYVKSTKSIGAGEELFLDYGDRYWNTDEVHLYGRCDCKCAQSTG